MGVGFVLFFEWVCDLFLFFYGFWRVCGWICVGFTFESLYYRQFCLLVFTCYVVVGVLMRCFCVMLLVRLFTVFVYLLETVDLGLRGIRVGWYAVDWLFRVEFDRLFGVVVVGLCVVGVRGCLFACVMFD